MFIGYDSERTGRANGDSNFARALFFAAAMGFGSLAAAADAFPVRPVTFVVPYAPGGPNDIIARLSGDELSKGWKQPVLIENRAGGGGLVGASYVSQRPPDGHTFFISTNVLTFPIFNKDSTFRPKEDVTPITILVGGPHLLVGTANGRSLADLVAIARTSPGKLNVGVISMTVPHLDTAYLFQRVVKSDVAMIPYNSATQALQALVAGQIDMFLTSIQNAKPQVLAGRLRGLAVASGRRTSDLPEVATFQEQGYAYEAGFWLGIYGPRGLPANLANRLSADFATIFEIPAIRDRIAGLGMNLILSGADEMKRRMEEEERRDLDAAKLVNLN